MRYESKPDFWGTDLLTLRLESALSPQARAVSGAWWLKEVALNLSQSYAFAVEVVPTFDSPQVFVEAQATARADEDHAMRLGPRTPPFSLADLLLSFGVLSRREPRASNIWTSRRGTTRACT